MNTLKQKNRNSCFYNEYGLIINKFFFNTFRFYTEIHLKIVTIVFIVNKKNIFLFY